MAKGAEAKSLITQKILDAFPDSFTFDKEIRIPWMEDGNLIQIKVALTCAKTNVEPDGSSTTMPTEGAVEERYDFPETAMNEPTDEEKANVEELLQKLGLN